MKWKSFALVALSALVTSLSRLPLYTGWMVMFAMIPLLRFFEQSERSPKELAIAATLYSAFYIPLLMYWIVLVTPVGLVGIFVLYSWYFFLAFYAIALIYKYLPRYRYLGFASVMLALEYIQNYGELRFPWLNLAYSLADYTSLMQFADFGGVIGLSALIIIVNVLLLKIWQHRTSFRAYSYFGWLMILLGVWQLYGSLCLKLIRLDKSDPKIFVMQPSIEQEDKWDTDYFNSILSINRELTIKAAKDSAALIIWPEAAMPTYMMHNPAHLGFVQNLASLYGISIFTGFPDYRLASFTDSKRDEYYNSATLIKPLSAPEKSYHKIILVPVGERIPWLKYIPILWKLQFGQANWEYGKEVRLYEHQGESFAPSICYEIAFADLHHVMSGGKAQATQSYSKTDFLVNLTNDAWFGTSYGPWLHAVHTRFRAIENRIQIYRSANTGISMIVDPLGRVISKAPLFTRTNIHAPLYKTPYIPPIRKFYMYPIGIVLAAIILTLRAIANKYRAHTMNRAHDLSEKEAVR